MFDFKSRLKKIYSPVFIDSRESIPSGYGFCYFTGRRAIATCYPIPLNILIALYKRICQWFMYGLRPSLLDELLYREYQRGCLDTTIKLEAKLDKLIEKSGQAPQ